jgi:hypothetical protein
MHDANTHRDRRRKVVQGIFVAEDCVCVRIKVSAEEAVRQRDWRHRRRLCRLGGGQHRAGRRGPEDLWGDDRRACQRRAGRLRAGRIRAGRLRAGRLRAGRLRAGRLRAERLRAGRLRAWRLRARWRGAWRLRTGWRGARPHRAGRRRARPHWRWWAAHQHKAGWQWAARRRRGRALRRQPSWLGRGRGRRVRTGQRATAGRLWARRQRAGRLGAGRRRAGRQRAWRQRRWRRRRGRRLWRRRRRGRRLLIGGPGYARCTDGQHAPTGKEGSGERGGGVGHKAIHARVCHVLGDRREVYQNVRSHVEGLWHAGRRRVRHREAEDGDVSDAPRV